jgi:hypothetical protein
VKELAIVIGLASLCGAPARGGELLGSQLSAKCQSDNPEVLASCDLYLEAVVGTTRAFGSVFDDYYQASRKTVLPELKSAEARREFNSLSLKTCIRPEEPIATVRKAFLDFLTRNPQYGQSPAYWAATFAIHEKWGCRVDFG